jgi:hypothetical protein
MRKNEEGLTLIEIVLGLTISAVIFVLLLGTMRLGNRSQEKGLARQELSQRVRILTDRLGWLVRGAYPYLVTEDNETTLYFAGSGDSVGFVTTSIDAYSETPTDRAGLKWVSISVDDDGLKLKERLYFADVLDGEGGEEYVLDPMVKSTAFQYLDPRGGGGEEASEEEWFSDWDGEEKDYLPTAIRISITIEQDGTAFEVPPVIAAIRTGMRTGVEAASGEERAPAAPKPN